ncbi:MAG: energy transducer TonB [Proteobacteria bacterium]|nr:energy transducer TonB [Pseudomonadota bacterium]
MIQIFCYSKVLNSSFQLIIHNIMHKLLFFIILLSCQFSSAQSAKQQQLKLIVSVQPNYPLFAAATGIEGFVDLDFTVDTNGAVKDVVVTSADPQGIFEDTAVQAILKYKFAPPVINNKSTTQRVSQKIVFTLADNKAMNNIDISKVLTSLTHNDTPFLAIYSIDIEEPKKSINYAYVLVGDKITTSFNKKLLIWDTSNTAKIELLKKDIIEQAKIDFVRTYGAFKQFHKICIDETCPPLPLSDFNSLNTKHFPKTFKFKAELTIDKHGKVERYKVLKKPKKFKKIVVLNELLANFKFLPAIKNNKPVKQTIVATIKAVATSQKINSAIWALDRQFYLNKPPQHWVRMALLISKKGKVLQAQTIESSDAQFETEATNSVKKYKFPKNKSTYQLIKTINFNPTE